ncbi:heavy-metal-associated domain-containing protein [Psychroserpens ponticola]|uniref:Heavy-metal-associated domain-containing protein n=1 Tax=Psychroserpens ponticola TaxID=2932268 RepID=A0ABY7RZ91_9FLAO|nr:heavy-metal-associated domain-containing protein [Psychroserpens ponticola]WCO02455.1 heavy-metal-associated domain-containing protein [Psychroserpens ponticola]
MERTLNIQNLKCGGCANTITTRLEALEGISNVFVNNDTNSVAFSYSETNELELAKTVLSTLGYPVEGESNPVSKKAKSFVSCAIGRLNN